MNKTTKIILVIVIALLAIGLIYWGITHLSQSQTIGNEPIKIGVSGVLTGEVAIWGQNALAGIQLATNEINDQGGINGRKIQLVVEDDKADPKTNVDTFTKLINIDNVTAIIGASGSGATLPAVSVSQNSKVPTVVAFASAPNITTVGDYIFRVGASDNLQGKFSAEYIYNKLNKRKIALVYVKNNWGQGVAEIFKARMAELGGDIVYETGVLPDELDYKTEINKVKEQNADILYFLAYPKNAIAAFKQMKELGFDLPVICGDAIEGEDVIANPNSEGVLYMLQDVNIPDDFKQRINALPGFGNLKLTLASPLGYDAAKVLFSAIEKAGTDKAQIQKALTQTSLKGISSPLIEFDANGDLKNALFQVKIIKNRQSIPFEQ